MKWYSLLIQSIASPLAYNIVIKERVTALIPDLKETENKYSSPNNMYIFLTIQLYGDLSGSIGITNLYLVCTMVSITGLLCGLPKSPCQYLPYITAVCTPIMNDWQNMVSHQSILR